MKPTAITLLAAVAIAISGHAFADKPAWAGNGGKSTKDKERGDERRVETGGSFRFNEDHRRIVNDYYGNQARAGKCPPGLAKKNNGCLPPGQAKKWARGRALAADIRYYDLPRDLLHRLPPPPARHRYVQIAGDILLIAIGTSMVVDAIEDILR